MFSEANVVIDNCDLGLIMLDYYAFIHFHKIHHERIDESNFVGRELVIAAC